MLFCYVFLYEQRTEAVNDKGGEPCDHALCDDNENRPFAAKLAFDRGDRCDAGCIQQAENRSFSKADFSQLREMFSIVKEMSFSASNSADNGRF